MLVLGIDPSTTRIALADDQARTIVAAVANGDKGPARLADIHRHTRLAIRRFVGERSVPRLCFVESPGGHVHPSLWQAVGVVQAAAYLELARLRGAPVVVRTIGPTQWKKLLLGKGSADKDEILEWARAHGFNGSSQDEADAYAIARVGVALVKPI